MQQQINLYQDSLIDKPQPLQALQSVILILIVSIALGLMYGYCYWHDARVALQLEELQKQRQAAVTRIATLAEQYPKLQENEFLKKKIHRLELKVEGQKQVLDYFSKQENNGNNSVLMSLTGLTRMPSQNLWLRRIHLRQSGEQVTLAGSALKVEQIPVYLQLLSENHIFGGKVFAGLQIERVLEKNGHIQFTLESSRETN